MLVYVGTYTGGESKGIYVCDVHPNTGELEQVGVARAADNPTFLALSPAGQCLYATHTVPQHATVSAWAVRSDGTQLSLLNRRPAHGSKPCHVTVDRTGKHVLTANFGDGSVCCFPTYVDGRLAEATCVLRHRGHSVHPLRQAGPHAHSVALDPGGRYAFAADLGIDRVMIYRYDWQRGQLAPGEVTCAEVPPGSGPRHFTFHPSGRFAYLINEIANTVSAFAYDFERGALDPLQAVSTLPEGYADGSAADIHVHASGLFLYGSNRGHDSIAVFAIDTDSGRLEPRGHHPTLGQGPRNFCILPRGDILLAANAGTDNVVSFRIDGETGALERTGYELRVPSPVCLVAGNI